LRKVYANAVALKPTLKISAALITWGDGPRDTDDWVNRSAYSRVFQDWRGWLEEGILDMAIPMIYYHQANPERARFYQNWVNFLKDLSTVGTGWAESAAISTVGRTLAPD
jgi:uncharacterized lipoprotein YddW (UPF0748 family)